MRKTLRADAALVAIAASLTLTFLAPLSGAAQEYTPALAPDAAAWSDASGYTTLEANRAAASALVIASAPDAGATSGYNALVANRAIVARQALQSGDIGSGQEAMLSAIVAAANAAAMAWGDASGYNALELNRAAMLGSIAPAPDELYAIGAAPMRA